MIFANTWKCITPPFTELKWWLRANCGKVHFTSRSSFHPRQWNQALHWEYLNTCFCQCKCRSMKKIILKLIEFSNKGSGKECFLFSSSKSQLKSLMTRKVQTRAYIFLVHCTCKENSRDDCSKLNVLASTNIALNKQVTTTSREKEKKLQNALKRNSWLWTSVHGIFTEWSMDL